MTDVPIAAPAKPARKMARKLSVPVVIAATILACWTLVALIGPLITPQDPTAFVANDGFVQVEGITLLGTDYLGRDLFSRIIDGTRITLFTAFLATLLAHGLGSSLGILATVKGGWLDTLLSRIVDVVLSLPKIIVGLVVIAATGPSLTVLILVTGVVYAAAVFRIARALSADVAQLDFVRSARARGEGALWLIGGEILPNIAVPLAADFALRFSFAVLFISNLSFLGLGVQPPQADWGALVRENLSGLGLGSLAPIYPALAIASVTISASILVDATEGARSKKVIE